MATHRQIDKIRNSPSTRTPKSKSQRSPHPAQILQRLESAPDSIRPADVLTLQRTIGNRATGRILQAKLKLGPAGDRYEQEADRVAKQVVRASRQPDVQRNGVDEEELQAKPVDRISQVRRSYLESAVQATPIAKSTGSIQRGFAALSPVQRDGIEDEELQAAPNHGLEGGEVDDSVAQSIQRAKGGGAPLDDGVRSSMEQGFGADFSGVRVHTGGQADALNRSLNARAFTTGNDIFFGKGQYNPGSSGGQELIAHELTHTVQQGAAGVQRWPEIPASADTPDHIQRLVRIDEGSDDYPEKKKRRRFKKDQTVGGDTEFFVSQTENEGSSYVMDGDKLKANLVYKSTADLMVADNLDLAIEADVEAKYFFATKARVKEANDNLNGNVRLRTTSRYLKINSDNGTIKLFQVEPYVPKKKQSLGKSGSGIDMRIPQRCNEMSEFVTGKVGVETGAGRQIYGILATVLTQIGERDFETELREALTNIGSVQGNQTYLQLTDEMHQAYKDALAEDDGEERINEVLSEVAVNQFMDPVIGSSITTYGVGTDEENANRDRDTTFGYHFGAVVARSGPDYITLENYARRDDLSTGTLSAGDPLFFFRMYGLESPTDTWHQKALDTGAFVGRAISFVVE